MTDPSAPFAQRVAARLQRLAAERVVERVWARDPTVWAGRPAAPEVADRLGWLSLPDAMGAMLRDLAAFAGRARRGFDRIVLLGMGGSSLAPEVLWRTRARREGFPSFLMLDSTHPDAVRAAQPEQLDRTLFVVSSKSGTTIETQSLFRYFWEATRGRGRQFVAITDPDTPLDALATARKFRRVFRNPPDIGGRYAALSLVGLVPAALAGVDVAQLIRQAGAMAERCRVPEPADNPGASLGAWLGEAACAGRDKLTLCLPPPLAPLGLWVEQLVAESTGKDGRGILPIVDEPPAPGGAYGDDRAFVVVTVRGARDAALAGRASALERAGHPVLRLEVDAPAALGGEFFRWEFATAIAGAVLGVNPFDQPNVDESKRNTERALRERRFDLGRGARRTEVRAFLGELAAGHYLAVLAWLPPTPALDRRLAELQGALRDRTGVAVTVGYGPRFLHSTGQFHKGGPPVGHFLQLVDLEAEHLPIPGEVVGFGELLAAQAVGDAAALAARGRPVLRVHDLDQLFEAI